MKKTLTISSLLLLLALSISAAIPQQTMTPEKKSAMHKLDPVDLFPQVRERSGKDRNRNNRSSNSGSADLTNNSSEPEPRASSRRNSRRRHSSERGLPTDSAAITTPTPAPTTLNSEPEPTATASPAVTPDSSIAVGETTDNKAVPPPQTLAAMGNLPASGGNHRNPILSLPIILVMLALVLIALVFAFAKLIRFLRGPVI
ncbi:MAG: hypothetical protein ACRD82_02540 [Blastocatellia bacterium]